MASFFNNQYRERIAQQRTSTVVEAERPGFPPKLKPRVDKQVMSVDQIEEYRQVAEQIGLSAADMAVEEFRLFLSQQDLPVFNHKEVVRYMDDLTAKDNPTGLGWHWCPVREKDCVVPMSWGRPSSEEWDRVGMNRLTKPASDFYESHRFREAQAWGNNLLYSGQPPSAYHAPDWRSMGSPAYSRTIPLHALKKIALIEREYKGAVAPVFLVTEYTTQPHVVVNPDPFLMAVIPNSAVSHGKGRFIIDVWDEPGFGIDQMLK